MSATVAAMAPGPDHIDRADVPPIRFAQARGARLAYQDYGEGPVVLAVPPLAQNIEVAWEWPDIRNMMERFGTFSRWIQFDKRGTGASDRRSHIPGLDERVEDLRAVMDDAGVERGFLYGASEGGPMCVLFAATYPDRVDGLILHGTTSSWQIDGATAEQQAEAEVRRLELAEVWGTPQSPIAEQFSPSLADNEEYRSWLQRYERLAADGESLRELLAMVNDFDVSDLLADIDVPTLVMHRTGDRVIPVERGRALAAEIPGAEFIEHPGDDHFAFAGDMGWLVDLERFVTGTVQDRPLPARPTRVSIQTLGRFVVEVDGAEVPVATWKSRMARDICKRLVAARGWPITRDELFDALWPDQHDRSKLSARLSVHLSHVRRVLGGGVTSDRQTIALNLEEVSTDIEAFFAADDDATIVERYHGEFLPEDAYEDWTTGMRDETRLRFVLAARNLAEAALEMGGLLRASELAGRLIEVDRYDEKAHRIRTTALVRSNEHTLAHTAYDEWCSAMAELGVAVPAFDSIQ